MSRIVLASLDPLCSATPASFPIAVIAGQASPGEVGQWGQLGQLGSAPVGVQLRATAGQEELGPGPGGLPGVGGPAAEPGQL